MEIGVMWQYAMWFGSTSTWVLRLIRLCMLHMWINIKWQYAMWIYSISTMISWFIRICNILKCHVPICNVKFSTIIFVFGNVLTENKIGSMYLIIVNWWYVTICNVKLFNIHFAFVNKCHVTIYNVNSFRIPLTEGNVKLSSIRLCQFPASLEIGRQFMATK